MDLQDLINKPCWSPRREFPPSRLLSNRIFTSGEGIYLLTNPMFGEGDPVYAVGWAQSDYWAKRAWEVPFSGQLTAPPAQWGGPPSLQFLSRPKLLSFVAVLDFERTRPGAKTVTLFDGSYRFADGAFLYSAIHGTDGLTFIYESNAPNSTDQPVAIEFRLPEYK